MAKAIFDKYREVRILTDELLPVYSNQKTNQILKEIANACGIHNKLFKFNCVGLQRAISGT